MAGIAALLVSTSAAAGPAPVEHTLAFELLASEKQVRGNIPKGVDAELRSVLDAATMAATNTNSDPQSAHEALAVLRAIQLALEHRNLIQPGRQRDWPNTLGEAFTPHDASEESVRQARADWGNFLPDRELGARTDHIDWHRPVYLVDCDMGALLFISVGQRLGWDIRLVEAAEHVYLHWHLKTGRIVNWDWTTRQSVDDRLYRDANYESAPELDPKGKSLSLDFARGLYLAFMSQTPINDEVLDRTKANALLESALTADPGNYKVQNALAWSYATDPKLASAKAETALAYALAAWKRDPREGDMADTVACAHAAAKDFLSARDVERTALSFARKGQRDKFQKDLAAIAAGRLCEADYIPP